MELAVVGDPSVVVDPGGVGLSVILPVAVILGGFLGALLSKFLDKSDWRNVAESRGAENEDLRHKVDDLEKRVKHLEAQIDGVLAIKSEEIAHRVLEGLRSHRGS